MMMSAFNETVYSQTAVSLEKFTIDLSSTNEKKLTLKYRKALDLICYVDASIVVHDDYKSHTGIAITINGKCMVSTKSTK